MGTPLTYVDGLGPLTDWEYNGTDLQRAYMDNELVFIKALRLHLPCNPNYTVLNLREFIDARNPNNAPVIIVYQDAGCSHPTLNTGNLAGLHVMLRVEGSLEAGSTSTPALNITSELQVINTGWIRGYGGQGGQGGTGVSGTSSTEVVKSNWEDKFSYGTVCLGSCGNTGNTMWAEDTGAAGNPWYPGTLKMWNGAMSGGGCNSLPSGYEYRRGAFHCPGALGQPGTCAGGLFNTYHIQRRTNKTVIISGGTGGTGGTGGVGQYYKHPAQPGSSGLIGAAGSAPEGTRGHRGGAGGAGGSWSDTGSLGLSGEGGGTAGSPGLPGGIAVTGSSYMIPGSVIGNVDSGIT